MSDALQLVFSDIGLLSAWALNYAVEHFNYEGLGKRHSAGKMLVILLQTPDVFIGSLKAGGAKKLWCPLNINFSICRFLRTHGSTVLTLLGPPMLSLCIKLNPRVSGTSKGDPTSYEYITFSSPIIAEKKKRVSVYWLACRTVNCTNGGKETSPHRIFVC